MHSRGTLSPETAEEAREAFDDLEAAARSVVRETAREMGFDGEEYGERVTEDVVATAREALFASLLAVRVGTRSEFEAWRADHEDLAVIEEGHSSVERVAWHVARPAGTVLAATFQSDEDAAVGTLRRMAFARLYRDAVADSG